MTFSPKRSGFTLIELIIVVSIITVLAGMAVPYYNDYVSDTRRSVLKQNMANMRKVINDFRGDHRRGPFRVQITSGTVGVDPPAISKVLLVDPKSNNASGSELVSGVLQATRSGDSFTYSRRRDVVYLPALPTLEDPQTSGQLTWNYGTATLYFVDYLGGPDGKFDMANEFAYVDGNGDGKFTTLASDSVAYASQTNEALFVALSAANPNLELDFIGITASDSTGVNY